MSFPHKHFFCSALAVVMSTLQLHAQEFYQPDTTVKVFAYGKELNMPWCGGFNNPELGMADLNRDGKLDLVAYERNIGVSTFLHSGVGADGIPIYKYAPKYALNFPPIKGYMYLLDYNCDGIADLFDRGDDGFGVYKGYYNGSNQLCFTFYRSLFYYNDPISGGPSNAYVNPSDIPGIADVDGDGDLDFVSYYITGGYMYYHQNMRVEDGLPCDSIRIRLDDRCWGKVYQNINRAHQLGYSCDNSGLLRGAAERRTHPGNTTCLFDWDMDGDMDYIDGNVSFNDLQFIKNGKVEYGSLVDTLVEQDSTWQSSGHQVQLPSWPAAFNIDIDQDGKKDLLISPNLGTGTENYKCIWFYKNNSTPGFPDWEFKSDTFLIDRTIDLGSTTYPLLFDYNKDGKLDLLVGSEGYRQPGGLMRATMSLYINTSTPDNPSFTLESKDLISMSSQNFQGTAPAVGDIDNDGKSDLIVGHSNGRLTYYKNIASSEGVMPDWQLMELELKDDMGNIIDVDGGAAPYIYDVDKDGRKDLVIGSIYGYIRYYRNISIIVGGIKLKLINTKLGKAKADPIQNFGIYSTPFIGKIDETGIDYLLMGSNSGNIYKFSGIASGDTTLEYTLEDPQYSWIDSTYNIYNSPMYGIYTVRRTSVTVGDIDGSGSYVLIKGNIKGGLELYKRKVFVGDSPVSANEGKIIIYPNPAQEALNISWSGINDTQIRDVSATITDMLGRVCKYKSTLTRFGILQFMVTDLPPGVYICTFIAGDKRHVSKFTVAR